MLKLSKIQVFLAVERKFEVLAFPGLLFNCTDHDHALCRKSNELGLLGPVDRLHHWLSRTFDRIPPATATNLYFEQAQVYPRIQADTSSKLVVWRRGENQLSRVRRQQYIRFVSVFRLVSNVPRFLYRLPVRLLQVLLSEHNSSSTERGS